MHEYVPPVPTGSAFLNHWYVGVPPLTGVGVNVTEVPAQISLADGEIETLTGSNGFTVMTTVFEAAGLPVLQARLEAMTTYTRSPFAGMQEYVSPVPTGSEFLYHW
jgi:hypothetical protein